MMDGSDRDEDPIDVRETEHEYVVRVELEGVRRDALTVRLDQGSIQIEGARVRDRRDPRSRFHRVERTQGMFKRSIALPDHVQPASVHTELVHGVLSVHVQKVAKAGHDR